MQSRKKSQANYYTIRKHETKKRESKPKHTKNVHFHEDQTFFLSSQKTRVQFTKSFCWVKHAVATIKIKKNSRSNEKKKKIFFCVFFPQTSEKGETKNMWIFFTKKKKKTLVCSWKTKIAKISGVNKTRILNHEICDLSFFFFSLLMCLCQCNFSRWILVLKVTRS